MQKEFEGLAEDAGIYKLIGPVLQKQDKSEATSAVHGRLEFINNEIGRTEDRIKELQKSSDGKRGELMQLQQKMQTAAQGQTAG